jgi:hypothetical protein
MTYSRLSTHDGDDPEENDVDPRTPLDRTIDRIGMGTFSPSSNRRLSPDRMDSTTLLGTYQWTLLSLCGFGEWCCSLFIRGITEGRVFCKVGWPIM